MYKYNQLLYTRILLTRGHLTYSDLQNMRMQMTVYTFVYSFFRALHNTSPITTRMLHYNHLLSIHLQGSSFPLLSAIQAYIILHRIFNNRHIHYFKLPACNKKFPWKKAFKKIKDFFLWEKQKLYTNGNNFIDLQNRVIIVASTANLPFSCVNNEFLRKYVNMGALLVDFQGKRWSPHPSS